MRSIKELLLFIAPLILAYVSKHTLHSQILTAIFVVMFFGCVLYIFAGSVKWITNEMNESKK